MSVKRLLKTRSKKTYTQDDIKNITTLTVEANVFQMF